MAKTTRKPAKRGSKRKAAPLAVGSRRGSAGAGSPSEGLGRLEQDLVAAIDDAIATLQTLRGRVEELGAERAATQPQGLLATATPMLPTNIRTD